MPATGRIQPVEATPYFRESVVFITVSWYAAPVYELKEVIRC